MKNCLKCGKELSNNRKKFCDDHCKYWYNIVRKEKEAYLAPFKKRNKNFFSMIIGYHNSLKYGQGRRSKGMVKGAMGAIVNITTKEWAEVNYDNIKNILQVYHFLNQLELGLGMKLG